MNLLMNIWVLSLDFLCGCFSHDVMIVDFMFLYCTINSPDANNPQKIPCISKLELWFEAVVDRLMQVPDMKCLFVRILYRQIYEVSIAEFEYFVQNAYEKDSYWSKRRTEMERTKPGAGAGKENRRAGRDDNHPVVAVSWYEAFDAFCRYKGGFLPTEAQWERAACPKTNLRSYTASTKIRREDNDNIEAVWYSGGKYGHLTKCPYQARTTSPKKSANT